MRRRTAAGRSESGKDEYFVIAEAYVDVISIFVYKNARLGKAFWCQLYPQPGGLVSSDDLVLPSISPRPLIGTNFNDSNGQLYASILASMINRQSTDDNRGVFIALASSIGPEKTPSKADREELLTITRLVETCRVW